MAPKIKAIWQSMQQTHAPRLPSISVLPSARGDHCMRFFSLSISFYKQVQTSTNPHSSPFTHEAANDDYCLLPAHQSILRSTTPCALPWFLQLQVSPLCSDTACPPHQCHGNRASSMNDTEDAGRTPSGHMPPHYPSRIIQGKVAV